MATTGEAAAQIIEGFKQSNGTFHRERRHDENDRDVAAIIDRAISQLIAAVGHDIEHAVIVNAPTGAPGSPFDYHCAVFGRGLLGYIEFSTSGNDPQLIVRTVPRSSITEIEVRAAKEYRSENGRLVFVVTYASGIRLDIRERGTEGDDVAEPGVWLQEILKDLREDLAAA